MLKTLREKLGTKFPATTITHGYSMVKIAHNFIDDTFSGFFYLEASLVEGPSRQ